MINTCTISIILANACLLYTMACIYYLIQTRNIGTPFNNSLHDFQKKIKEKASTQRRNIFYQGILLCTILIYLWNPFKNC